MNALTPIACAPDIVLKGLHKTYGSGHILHGLDLVFKAGELNVILGPSGCGKSTLLRMVAGLEDVSKGQILMGGRDVTRLPPKERGCAMVFQNYALYPHMSVADNIGYALKLARISRKEREQRIRECASSLGLEELLQRKPGELSGGQRQRIALARAMMLQPKVLVADEPTSALDVSIQAQVLNLFMDLQQEFNTAYVFISHNLSVVRHVADTVLVMYLGRPAEMGPKEEIYNRPLHPYTQALLSATPTIHPDPLKPKIKIVGELPNPLNPPSGCAFHKRCPYATERCATDVPELRLVDNRQVACHYAEQFVAA
ncbi:Dipeptide transporter ATP-binding subunit [Pseudomonas savastanoi pv. glycinea]|uniref:Dipeptide transporter ATP-binding subunit n=1 Tax=Pseudomonas amygdali pv. eriobotryae TaxID=129137 RepID=A0A3M3VZV8_PSEA0|nr:oligopeptide/dipeptide ABC transporter ATP-binding protein [Pseudomonas savastanoi]RMN14456.1 Dipeptide transporter ATP-binding subunit [Pseudomonas savastanoi pv. glycinea]RMO50599.1 Dipeptide transporter ATP-binding subunit [Pseudomonas amygdali pv. eriobotryae]